MRTLFSLLIALILFSCKSKEKICVTELNTVGKVVSVKECKDCVDGGFIYKIEINPEEKEYIKYITDCIYKPGDMIYFKMTIQKEDYE